MQLWRCEAPGTVVRMYLLDLFDYKIEEGASMLVVNSMRSACLDCAARSADSYL